jgi:hypothetical protein
MPGTTKSVPDRGDGGDRQIGVQERPVRVSLPVLLLLALAGGACSKQIGDGCSTAADCDPNGTRACDLSQPGGYCTVANCDETSCPSESACIRFFPTQFLARTCNPDCEDKPCQLPDGGESDQPDGGPPAICPATCPRGATNDCAADELCLDAGWCAPRTTERRFCEKTCGGDGDCRGGYECRLAGTQGSMAFTQDLSKVVRFCAPKD